VTGAASAALGAVLLLASAVPGRADEGIARRLAALDALVGPASAKWSGPPAPREEAGCGSSWWRRTGYGVRLRTADAVRDAALRFGVDRRLLWSVIRVESNYDPDAVSHAGAMGLMQLMPATARSLGVACPFDPRENVLGGARYLRRLRDRLGSWRDAVAAYHAGPAAVRAGRLGPETRRYVERVLAAWRGGTAGGPRLRRRSGGGRATSTSASRRWLGSGRGRRRLRVRSRRHPCRACRRPPSPSSWPASRRPSHPW
jgi:soluble lytic murein transglycosylase-like protein